MGFRKVGMNSDLSIKPELISIKDHKESLFVTMEVTVNNGVSTFRKVKQFNVPKQPMGANFTNMSDVESGSYPSYEDMAEMKSYVKTLLRGRLWEVR